MGPCTASSCCCQARNLPWAPCTASSCCCQVQSLSWIPVRPPMCCCLHRHTLPCATFRSPPHCWCVPFCHEGLADYGPPIAAARPRNSAMGP
ncbi:unnamed protein product [Staurois parvus]|uniref:Secreted protein n=1 Tax=Staurois parvus TaxID=386267 RepID=A0ABN9CHE0_9NEOB|nr:unnamed protein product [Staurois parvus]